MSALDDGIYDAVVIDARDDDARALHLELALTSGARKGDVVRVVARGLERDALDLLGLPVTLHVDGGMPRVEVE